MTHFAIFATDDLGQDVRLDYVAESEDADAAMEAFADDVMSSDRSVEAGWTWSVYEIPSDIASDDDAIYDYCADRSGMTKETPMLA
jgi:anaerobic ribonucleoside-triphosphate reductase